MKPNLIRFAVGIILLVSGFVGGRFYQSAKNGYHLNVLDEKEYQFPLGPIHWSCVIESVGFPFLDTEKTIIEFNRRTIYKAQRDFQENAPIAQNITTSNKSIDWDDGDYRFHLTINEIKNTTNAETSQNASP